MEAKWLVNLDVPAAAVEDLKEALGGLFGAQEGGDHDLPAGLKLAHGQGGGDLVVGALVHPVRFLRLGEDHEMVAHTQ
jgi:hypothetical protein